MRLSALVVNIRKKATWGCVFLLAALISIPLGATPPAPQAKAEKHADKLDRELQKRAKQSSGETDVIIEFSDDRDALNLVRGFGKAGRRLTSIKGVVAKIPNHLLAKLAAQPAVKRVSHDRPVKAHNGRTAIATGARAVQELSGYTGDGIGVAVIDSGVTSWHEDLSSLQTYTYTYTTEVPSLLRGVEPITETVTFSYWGGQRVSHFMDFVTPNDNGYYWQYDDWGHGSHVSGTIAGNGQASGGVHTAMAPGASIIGLKALDAQGAGTISRIIAALDYAVSVKDLYNIRIINLSLGAGVYESYLTDPLTLAARRAVDAGIVVVAAAGNLGQAADGTPQYGAITAPANAPWVLTVGASSTQGTTDRGDDIVAPYSSRGPTMIDYRAKPDLVAPGSGTVSLSDPFSTMYALTPHLLLPGSYENWYLPYLSLSGTSMAAPAVAGTVALMLEANPNLTPNLVKAILQFTAQIYGNYNWLTQGAGFLNTRAAVRLAEYFAQATPGAPYPDMTGWSRHIFWGNLRVSGGVLTPGGTAWDTSVGWGDTAAPLGQNIVWGENCTDTGCDNIVWGNNIVWGQGCDGDGCDNIVWGNTDGDNIVWGQCDGDTCDNIVWGNGEDDNIVWGNGGDDNIVWGQDCEGDDCDNIVWGEGCDAEGCDNIVWGQCHGDGCDNIVWGNGEDDNIVWGENCEGDGCDNIVWGNFDGDDNIVWGNSVEQVVFGDATAAVGGFDAAVWDDLFTASVPAALSTGGR